MAEVYTSPFTVTLASAYTAGSGTLAVSAAAPVAIQSGTFRVRLGNASNTVLKVTGGASTTTWTVVAEFSDANASSGSSVYGCEFSPGALDQIRSDDRLVRPTFSSSALVATGQSSFGPIFPLTAPPSASSLSWVNQGAATASDLYGGILLNTPAVATDQVRMLVKSAPATPYSLTIAFLIDNIYPGTPNINVGIGVRDSASGRISQFGIALVGSSWELLCQNWNSPTSWNANIGTPSAFGGFPPFLFLRLTDDGTNFKFALSSTGLDFSNSYVTVARTSFLANPNQVGFLVDTTNSKIMNFYLLHWAGV